MKILKKAAPIVAALGLAATTLFGNPLETTILKEDNKSEMVDFTGSIGNKNFSLDASLPMGNNWEWDFSSDMSYADTPRINNVDMAIGNDKFYVGASYGDLSTESLLKDSYIFKVQTGLRLFDWLDFSVTGAYVNLPNMTSQGFLQTPFSLYSVASNLDVGRKFYVGSVELFPWLSIVESSYWAVPQNTPDFQTATQDFPQYDANMMSFPFDHLNVKIGLDLESKFIDVGYQGTFEGQSIPIWVTFPFNVTNKVDMSLHNEEKTMSMDYGVSLITKPPYANDGLITPVVNELQFDINAFALFKNGIYLKGQISSLVDFVTPTQTDIIAAIGKKFDWGNLELYYNSKNNIVGLMGSTKLDKGLDKESKARNNYSVSSRSMPQITSPNFAPSPNPSALHNVFGNTLEEAISKIQSESDVSQLASMIHYQEHDGTYTAQQEYETGFGVCRDTNGNLLPYIESKAFNYKQVYSVGLRGPFISHAVVVIQTQDGKFDLRNYEEYYSVKAASAEAAVEAVFPGAQIYNDGTVSSSVSTVRNAVERSIYNNWNKFKD